MARSRLAAAALAAASLLAACGGFVTTLPTTAPTATPTTSPVLPGPAPLDPTAIRADLEALQRIADQNGGTRAAGTPGYDASVGLVADRLRSVALTVEEDPFEMPVFHQDGPASVDVIGTDVRYVGDDRVKALLYAPAGAVEGPLTPLPFDTDGAGRGGGCDAAEFTAFPAGGIALLQPGPCFVREKVLAAQEAGAAAVIVSFDAYTEGAVLRPGLIDPQGLEVPVVSIAGSLGRRLVPLAGQNARLVTRVRTETRTIVNVIGEIPGRNPDRVVMLGGHLDSVIEGPGINDNGSGVALLLALGGALAESEPEATIRFGFWGGEELGLWGSYRYLQGLVPSDVRSIEAYLNFDMVGSPNFVRQVYVGAGRPAGSDPISEAFLAHFRERGLAADPDETNRGASDHAAFEDFGIATGGLFTGASRRMTAGEAARFGGTAGEPYDACYHLACDRAGRVDLDVLLEMAEAALAVTADLAGVDLPASMAA